MARLVVDEENVILRLAWPERLRVRRREVRVPLAAVKDVRVEPDWWRALRGTPRSGRCRPDRYCVGERQHPLGRDLVAVRVGVPVVLVELWRPVPFIRLAVSVTDAERVARKLRKSLPLADSSR